MIIGKSVYSLEQNSIICIVDNEKILYKDIAYKESAYNKEEKEELELEQLKDIIKKTIILKECKKMLIKVSENEVRERIDSLFQKGNINEETARLIADKIKKIISALLK